MGRWNIWIQEDSEEVVCQVEDGREWQGFNTSMNLFFPREYGSWGVLKYFLTSSDWCWRGMGWSS